MYTVVMLALWAVLSFAPTVIGDDSSSDAPIRVVDGLFDQSDSEKLGLPTIPGGRY